MRGDAKRRFARTCTRKESVSPEDFGCSVQSGTDRIALKSVSGITLFKYYYFVLRIPLYNYCLRFFFGDENNKRFNTIKRFNTQYIFSICTTYKWILLHAGP